MFSLYGIRITAATLITLCRFFLIPFIAYAITLHAWYYAIVLFVSAVVTDVLDGAVARWRNEITTLGACLDPVADKLLISTTLAMLWLHLPLHVPYLGWVIIVIYGKELLLIVGIAALYSRVGSITIQPIQAGKQAMLYQTLFVVMLLLHAYRGFPHLNFIGFFMWVVLGAAIRALIDYSLIGWRSLKKSAF